LKAIIIAYMLIMVIAANQHRTDILAPGALVAGGMLSIITIAVMMDAIANPAISRRAKPDAA
jgi:hypothetical protein